MVTRHMTICGSHESLKEKKGEKIGGGRKASIFAIFPFSVSSLVVDGYSDKGCLLCGRLLMWLVVSGRSNGELSSPNIKPSMDKHRCIFIKTCLTCIFSRVN